MGIIANLAHRAHNARTTRVRAIESLFFVNMRTLDLVLVVTIARGSHDGKEISLTSGVDSSAYSLEKKREELYYKFHVPGTGNGGMLYYVEQKGPDRQMQAR